MRFVILATLLLLLSLASFASDTTAPAVSGRTLVIAGPSAKAAPPYSWVDPCTHQVRGYIDHLLREVLTELGVRHRRLAPVDVHDGLFKQFSLQLSQGQVDSIAAIFQHVLSTPVVYGEEPITVMEDVVLFPTAVDAHYESLADLYGKTGVVFQMPDLPQQETLLNYYRAFGLTLEVYPDFGDAVDALMQGKVDYLVGDRHLMAIQPAVQAIRRQLSSQHIPALDKPLYFAVKKGSGWESLLPSVDQKLREHRQRGHATFLKESYMRAWLSSADCPP